MPNGPFMHLKMGSDLNSLSGAARTIETFLDGLNVGSKERYVVALAFEEMATNIIKYGFEGEAQGQQIDVRLFHSPAEIVLELEDSGREFNPLKREEPELLHPVEHREVGGLGVHLVRRMADSMDYKRINGRNLLTIAVKLNPACGPEGSK